MKGFIYSSNKEEQDRIVTYIQQINYLHNEWGKIQICTFSDTEKCMEEIKKGFAGFVFLDLSIHDKNGIKLVNDIRKYNEEIAIVFISSSNEYILESYDMDISYYLLKPITKKLVEKAVEKCMKKNGIERKYIVVKKGRRYIRIEEEDIQYIYSRGNKIVINLPLEELDIYITMKEFEAMLTNKNFVMIQRGIIVNMNYIAVMKKSSCILKNGMEYQLSRKESKSIYNKYIQYQYLTYKKGHKSDVTCIKTV